MERERILSAGYSLVVGGGEKERNLLVRDETEKLAPEMNRGMGGMTWFSTRGLFVPWRFSYVSFCPSVD